MTHKQLSWRCSNQALSVIALLFSISIHAMDPGSSSSPSRSFSSFEKDEEYVEYSDLSQDCSLDPRFRQFDARARKTARLLELKKLGQTNSREFIELSLPEHILEHVTFPEDQDPAVAKMYWDAAPEDLKIAVEDVTQNPDSQLFSLSDFPSRMAFWGVPGTGKSNTAAAIAWLLRRPHLFIRCSTLGTGIQNSSSENLKSFIEPVFKLCTPFVVTCDEINTLTQNIGLDDQQGTKAAYTLNSFMDSVKKRRDFLILSTLNEPETLPPATIDRFGVYFYKFKRLSSEQQIQKFIMFLAPNEKFKLDENCHDYFKTISQQIVGHSLRMLYSLASQIQSFANRRTRIEKGTVTLPLVIMVTDIEKAISRLTEIGEEIIQKGQGNLSLTQKMHNETIAIQKEGIGLQRDSLLHQATGIELQKEGIELQKESFYVQRDGIKLQKESFNAQTDAIGLQRASLLHQTAGIELQQMGIEQQQRMHNQSHGIAKNNETRARGDAVGSFAAVAVGMTCPLLAPVVSAVGKLGTEAAIYMTKK